jgi:hypothetical protein
MKNCLALITWIALSSLFGALSANAQSTPNSADLKIRDASLHNPLWNARVDAIDADHASLLLTDCPSGSGGNTTGIECMDKAISCSISSDSKLQLKALHLGDHTKVFFENGKTGLITSISPSKQTVSVGMRLFAMALAYLACFLLATLFSRGRPLKLIIGADNRYSNSKFQMALWFSVLISTYVATIVLRLHFAGWDFWGGVNIPAHLLTLSGVSILTFGAAKGITTSKVEAALSATGKTPKPVGTPHLFLDLVQNDLGNFDLGDFQMLVMTLLAVAMYLVTTFNFLETIESLKAVSLPDVDTTILAAFGLGQGAYLTKKVAGTPGSS